MKSLEDRIQELETKVIAQEEIIKVIVDLLNNESAIRHKVSYPIIEDGKVKIQGKILKNLNSLN